MGIVVTEACSHHCGDSLARVKKNCLQLKALLNKFDMCFKILIPIVKDLQLKNMNKFYMNNEDVWSSPKTLNLIWSHVLELSDVHRH